MQSALISGILLGTFPAFKVCGFAGKLRVLTKLLSFLKTLFDLAKNSENLPDFGGKFLSLIFFGWVLVFMALSFYANVKKFGLIIWVFWCLSCWYNNVARCTVHGFLSSQHAFSLPQLISRHSNRCMSGKVSLNLRPFSCDAKSETIRRFADIYQSSAHRPWHSFCFWHSERERELYVYKCNCFDERYWN